MQSAMRGHALSRVVLVARDVTPGFPGPALADFDPPDWELVVAGRQNVLLQGAEPALDAAVTLLRQQLGGPFQHWLAGSGSPLPPRLPGVLFLSQVDACSEAEQQLLLEWLQETDCRVQVVSTTTRRLSELVERGEFRADLYYRLNIVLLELIATSDATLAGLRR